MNKALYTFDNIARALIDKRLGQKRNIDPVDKMRIENSVNDDGPHHTDRSRQVLLLVALLQDESFRPLREISLQKQTIGLARLSRVQRSVRIIPR